MRAFIFLSSVALLCVSGTVIKFDTGKSVIPAMNSSTPACTRCYLGTSGPCQAADGICWPQEADGSCPTGTAVCQCPPCMEGTSGPCHHGTFACGPYSDSNAKRCPANAFECYVDTPSVSALENCPACYPGTSGPCQHEAGTVCFPYYEGTTMCPAGTVECASHQQPVLPAPGQCTGCYLGTSGSCQQANGVCWDFFPGTALCPTGTAVCETCDPISTNVTVVPSNGTAVGVNGGIDGNYTVSTNSTGNSTTSVHTELNPCADIVNATSDSTCLSIVVSVPTPKPNTTSNTTDITVQLPATLNAVLPANAVLTVQSLSKQGTLVNTCASSTYNERSGTVSGDNCAQGARYVIVLSSSGGSGNSGIDAVGTGVGVAIGGIALITLIALVVIFRRKRNASSGQVSPLKADNRSLHSDSSDNENDEDPVANAFAVAPAPGLIRVSPRGTAAKKDSDIRVEDV